MKRYAHVFFDLDHTLWDFRTNSRQTLSLLYEELALEEAGVPDATALIDVYEEINADLWRSYEAGSLPKDVLRVLRFRNTLRNFGVYKDALSTRMAERYLEDCPQRATLTPGASELLGVLASAGVRMHIITNGFVEVQHLKLKASGIAQHFDVVLTSERAKARKPDPRVFQMALRMAKAEVSTSLMVGDDPRNDVGGAQRAGIDQVYYAPDGPEHMEVAPTYTVAHLSELLPLFRT